MIHQPHVRFVDERGWLQGMVRTFVPEVTCGKFSKLGVNARREIVEGLPITARPLRQERRYFMAGRYGYCPALLLY